MTVTSHGAGIELRNNNLDFLRVGAALCVIIGHAFVLLGRADETPRIFAAPLHSFGVAVFFVISGYLITKSWLRTPHVVPYFAARILRIFPALIVVILGAVFVLGPVFTSLALSDYFTSPGTWQYLQNIALRPVFRLPGVFADLPFQGSVNGSLWTLPAEFACYLAVPLLLLVPGKLRVAVVAVVGVLIAVYALMNLGTTSPLVIYGVSVAQAATPWVFFAGGILCALVLKPGAYRVDVAMFLLILALVATSVAPQYWRIVLWILLPYIILSIGLAATPVVRRAARFGDLSYGLYIFAFPVQQTFIALFGLQSIVIDVCAVVAATSLLAFISWHTIESPMLKLKTRIASRREWSRSRSREVVPEVRVRTLVPATDQAVSAETDSSAAASEGPEAPAEG